MTLRPGLPILLSRRSEFQTTSRPREAGGTSANQPRYLINSYLEWAEAQGIPIQSGFGVDLRRAEVQPWPLLRGGAAAILVHLDGRGDFVNALAVQLPPGCRTDPQRHLYEEVIYVIQGHGGTSIEEPNGGRHEFEWGPGSVFALPLNCRHRHFNASGRQSARFAAVTNLPLVLNAFHDEAFVFDNPLRFPERFGSEPQFRGEGQFIPVRPGRHMWETNFVPDLPGFELQEWERHTEPRPSRYLAVAFGSIRYPFSSDKRALFGDGVDTSVSRGGRQIEYEDEDPRIRSMFRDALARQGLSPDPRMEAIWRTTAGRTT